MAVSVTQVVSVVGVPAMVVLRVCVFVRYSVDTVAFVTTEVTVLAGIVLVKVSWIVEVNVSWIVEYNVCPDV